MIHNRINDIDKRFLLERAEDWRGLIKKIPYISFKETWEVSMHPPYLGAIARFSVKKICSGSECSVYLDWFNVLGYFGGEPYWELHSFTNGEPERFELNDVAGVHDCIERKLELVS